MARKCVVMSVSLPPDLYQRAMAAAREESRTRSELVREALRVYLSRQRTTGRAGIQPSFSSLGQGADQEDKEIAAIRAQFERERDAERRGK